MNGEDAVQNVLSVGAGGNGATAHVEIVGSEPCGMGIRAVCLTKACPRIANLDNDTCRIEDHKAHPQRVEDYILDHG